MLRLKAFRPTNDKIVKIQLHPTHPWLVTADASDHVSVWNWEHRQVIYELKAGGVDERRLVGAKLEKLAEGESESKGKPTEALRGGSVRQVSFYDDDVRYWQLWRNRSAAAEPPSAVNQLTSAFNSRLHQQKEDIFLSSAVKTRPSFWIWSQCVVEMCQSRILTTAHLSVWSSSLNLVVGMALSWLSVHQMV